MFGTEWAKWDLTNLLQYRELEWLTSKEPLPRSRPTDAPKSCVIGARAANDL
jgi:hypothetical protein